MNKSDILFLKEEPKDDSFLWKFLDKDKFISMFLNQKLHLTRLDVFDDSNEGISQSKILFERYTDYLIQNIPELKEAHIDGMDVQINPTKIDKEKEKLENYQKSHFANCWFISDTDEESVAMWNLYSSPNSVAIKIQYKDFKKYIIELDFKKVNLKKMILGKVKYLNFYNPLELTNIDDNQLGFIKEISYSFENEYRILGEIEFKKPPKKEYKNGISKKSVDESYDKLYNIKGKEIYLKDFHLYPFKIVMHPKSQDWATQDLKKLLFEINEDFKFEIIESKLKIN